jgi:hypothetical protein
MRTPNIGNTYRGGVWAADSGCFNAATYLGDAAYLDWLNQQPRGECLFATCPDVVGDATATREKAWVLGEIRHLGFESAYVLQDGETVDGVPWDDLDWVFIGGTTEWKLGATVRDLVGEAKKRGKLVHMGRVNSWRRTHYAALIGCDSVDGTYLAFGPDVNRPKLDRWMRRIREQPTLL